MTESAAKQIRRVILEQSKRAHVGHIGSALSVADIIAALYDGVLRVRDPKDPERDRFVLAKGHAMLAVYAALFLKGWLTQEDLNTYCGDGTMLGVHPEYGLRGSGFRFRFARPGTVNGGGRRAGRAIAAVSPARLRPAERCRMQRRLRLGSRHVRRAPSTVQPHRHR